MREFHQLSYSCTYLKIVCSLESRHIHEINGLVRMSEILDKSSDISARKIDFVGSSVRRVIQSIYYVCFREVFSRQTFQFVCLNPLGVSAVLSLIGEQNSDRCNKPDKLWQSCTHSALIIRAGFCAVLLNELVPPKGVR